MPPTARPYRFCSSLFFTADNRSAFQFLLPVSRTTGAGSFLWCCLSRSSAITVTSRGLQFKPMKSALATENGVESQYIYPKLRRIRLPQSVINRYLSVFAAAAAQRTSAAAATNRGREKSCWVVAQRFAVGWNQQQQQFRSLFISLSRLAGLPKIKWTKSSRQSKVN